MAETARAERLRIVVDPTREVRDRGRLRSLMEKKAKVASEVCHFNFHRGVNYFIGFIELKSQGKKINTKALGLEESLIQLIMALLV